MKTFKTIFALVALVSVLGLTSCTATSIDEDETVQTDKKKAQVPTNG